MRLWQSLGSPGALAGGAIGRRSADREPDRRRVRRWRRSWKSPASGTRPSEVEPLLVQMAEAATRLLGRRSGQHLPLGPAEPHCSSAGPPWASADGELRIPDDRGVVGQVIQTGQPRRVDAATEPDADRPPGRRATRLPDPRRCCAFPCAAVGRAVRRVRADQQAVGQLHRGGRSGAGRAGRPCRRGPGERPGPPAAALDQPPDRRAGGRAGPADRRTARPSRPCARSSAAWPTPIWPC